LSPRLVELWSARLALALGTPMPLSLTTEEMDLLLALAGPSDQQLRPQFLQEVAAELEAKRQAGEIGEGAVHRVARTV
jgi:hypothetical protein